MNQEPLFDSESSRLPLRAIVLGASSGGFEAISELLRNLSADFRIPIFTVLHVPSHRKRLIAECLREHLHREVKQAEDRELIQEGAVYFAPPDYHLLVEKHGRLSLSNEAPVHYSRPSIDVLFESAAEVYGPALIEVILTGSNSDGANGLRAILDAGGMGFVEDPDLAQARVMPLAALQACPEARALTIPQIATCLQEEARAK